MAITASLDVPMRGDTKDLDAALGKAGKSLDDFGKKADQARQKALAAAQKQGAAGMSAVGGEALGALGPAGSMIGSFASKLAGLGPIAGVAVAGLAAVGAAAALIAAGVHQGITAMTELGKSAERLGMTTTALAGMQHGAALVGVSADVVTQKMERLEKTVAEAAQGGGKGRGVLAKLGLSAQELKDLPVEEMAGRIGDALNKVGSHADRVALGDKLLGKGSAEVQRFLALGSEGMAKMAAEAASLGPTSQQAVEEVRGITIGWAKFQETIGGMGRSLAVMFAPVLTDLMDWFGGVGTAVAKALADPANIEFARVLIDTLVEVGSTIFTVVNPGFELLMQLFGAAAQGGQGWASSWENLRNRILEVLFKIQWAFGNVKDVMILYVQQMANGIIKTLNEVLPDRFKLALIDMSATAERIAGRGKMDDFVKKKMKEFQNKVTAWNKPDEQRGKGDPLDVSVGKRPAAVEAGTKEAFHIMFGTEDYVKKAYHVQNDILKVQREQLQKMIEIAKKKGIYIAPASFRG